VDVHALIIWLRLKHTHISHIDTYRVFSASHVGHHPGLISWKISTGSLRMSALTNTPQRGQNFYMDWTRLVFSSKHQNCWDTEIEHNSVVPNPFWANKVANKLAYAKSVRTLMNFQGILMKMNSDTHDHIHIYIHTYVCVMNRLYSVDNEIKWLFRAIHPRHGVWCWCLEVPKLRPQRRCTRKLYMFTRRFRWLYISLF
jgi:hypothetical protein